MVHCKAGERDHCADPLALPLLLLHLLLPKLLLVDLLGSTLLRRQEDLPELTGIFVLLCGLQGGRSVCWVWLLSKLAADHLLFS